MAFSLLDHLQNSRQTEIQALVPAIDADGQRELLAIMLGQLIVLDRSNSQALYQAIAAQKHNILWQGLDDQAISQLAATTALPVSEFKSVLDQLYGYASDEIHSLDLTANLEQAGVSELIQGQTEYLAGAAPDQVWHVLNLTELQGQTATTETAVDLNASIASLNKLMMDASQMNTQTPDHAHHTDSAVAHDPDLHHDQHDPSYGHASIELPSQRPAPRFFLVLEPLIALLILIALWEIYNNLTGY
ncbi:hypothetical protein [Alkanindiges illinoisensis]|uniref:Uncharacterized protein n=1 Tax=Alkanindiges illinoisensis TaxID=197183 RepID=A0A4Y7XFI6_9GAMM|nr:hypothetical protein [Alkanindiges illinoisensis]TEU30611.1 hypothetical protein E2B99_01085 [Alkanindiges illinoisensis]